MGAIRGLKDLVARYTIATSLATTPSPKASARTRHQLPLMAIREASFRRSPFERRTTSRYRPTSPLTKETTGSSRAPDSAQVWCFSTTEMRIHTSLMAWLTASPWLVSRMRVFQPPASSAVATVCSADEIRSGNGYARNANAARASSARASAASPSGPKTGTTAGGGGGAAALSTFTVSKSV
jgi:hypothetical protein